jgi:hypothetical protein
MTWLGTAPQFVDHAIVDGAGVQPLPGLSFMKVGFRLMQPFMHRDFVIRTIAGMTKIPSEDYAEFKQGMLSMSPSSFTRSFLEASSMRLPLGLAAVSLAKPANADSYIAPGMAHGWLAEAPDLHCRMVQAWIQDEEMPEELARNVIS